MLYVYTGGPGTGKTCEVVAELLKNKKWRNRPVYTFGIVFTELGDEKIPHETIPHVDENGQPHEEGIKKLLSYLDWMPANGLLVIDEAQKYFRTRSSGAKVPKHVEWLETHRHKGIDIIMITQHPALLDTNVKRFVFGHKHIAVSGMGNRVMHSWTGKCANPDSKADKSDADTSIHRLDKDAYPMYVSSEMHTKSLAKRNKLWYIIPAVLIFIIIMLYLAVEQFSKFYGDEKADTVPEHVASDQQLANDDSEQSVQKSYMGNAPEEKLIKAEDYIPEMDGKPWTAPVYKSQNQNIQSMPFPVMCVINSGKKNRCTCYTDQSTPIRGMDDGLCRDFAENGIYNPYLAKGQSLPAVKQLGMPTSEPAQVLETIDTTGKG